MQTLWDPRKAAANLKKHSVSFEEASTPKRSRIWFVWTQRSALLSHEQGC